jgi:Spy/CpxP family protein refolding chaperone
MGEKPPEIDRYRFNYFKSMEEMMKKLKCLALAGGLLAGWCVYPLAVQADDSSVAPAAGPDNGTMQGPPPRNDQGSNPAAEPGDAMDGAWIDHAKDKLKLSNDQVAQLHKAVDDEKNRIVPLREDMKTQIQSLAQKLKAGAGDDALKPILDQIDQDRQDLAADQQKTTEAIRAVLTPTQQAKVILAMILKRMGMTRGVNNGNGPGGGNNANNGATHE